MPTDQRRRGLHRAGLTSSTSSFIAATWLLAAALVAISWHISGPPSEWLAVVVLAVLAALSWLFGENQVDGRIQLSFNSVVLLAAAAMVGPVGAGLVGVAGGALQWGRRPVRARMFNMAMLACGGCIGGLVYLAAGGPHDLSTVHGTRQVLLLIGIPLLAADLVECLANAALVAGVIRASQGIPVRAQAASLLASTGWSYVAYGVIAFLLVVLWVPAGVGWFSAVLVVAPLLAARWGLAQHGDERRAHQRTLNALVASVEARIPASAGHSARVADLAGRIAEAMNLLPRDVEVARTAGMLHDLGLLAVPANLLSERRALDLQDLTTLAMHAEAGAGLLNDIVFVRSAAAGVAHHHERFDGRGYPGRLAGEAIPVVGRIVAVADSFDVLQTTRTDRAARSVGQAIGDIEAAHGQFDPAVVTALRRVIERQGWAPPLVPTATPVLTCAGSAPDHALPAVSSWLAAAAEGGPVDPAEPVAPARTS